MNAWRDESLHVALTYHKRVSWHLNLYLWYTLTIALDFASCSHTDKQILTFHVNNIYWMPKLAWMSFSCICIVNKYFQTNTQNILIRNIEYDINLTPDYLLKDNVPILIYAYIHHDTQHIFLLFGYIFFCIGYIYTRCQSFSIMIKRIS